jgi:hypothetical protein
MRKYSARLTEAAKLESDSSHRATDTKLSAILEALNTISRSQAERLLHEQHATQVAQLRNELSATTAALASLQRDVHQFKSGAMSPDSSAAIEWNHEKHLQAAQFAFTEQSVLLSTARSEIASLEASVTELQLVRTACI